MIIVALSWSNKPFHIKDARSHEHQIYQRMVTIYLTEGKAQNVLFNVGPRWGWVLYLLKQR